MTDHPALKFSTMDDLKHSYEAPKGWGNFLILAFLKLNTPLQGCLSVPHRIPKS
jgi:hypothetical protein